MTRTNAIVAAIRRVLEARQQEIDTARDLSKVEIDLHFSPDQIEPREVVHRIERRERREKGGA